jgi:hypothetical protein
VRLHRDRAAAGALQLLGDATAGQADLWTAQRGVAQQALADARAAGPNQVAHLPVLIRAE